MTTQDIAAIVGKLTKAQREAVVAGRARSLTVARGLANHRLLGRYARRTGENAVVFDFTQLGLAVRSYLANHIDGKDRV